MHKSAIFTKISDVALIYTIKKSYSVLLFLKRKTSLGPRFVLSWEEMILNCCGPEVI